MTVLEMKDKIGLLEEENRNLVSGGKKESRMLNDEEKTKFDANLEAISKLEADIKEAEETRKVNESEKVNVVIKKMEKRFSLLKSIRDKVDGRPFDPEFNEVFEEGRSEFSRAGVESMGHITLPIESRAAIVTGQTTGTTAGGYAIQTDKKTVLPPLTNYMVLTKAGATYLTGLVGNVSIPTYSGTTVKWKGETGAATDGAGTWGKVDLNPKRLTAYVDVSKMFLLQDSVGAEAMLKENIAKAIAVKLESTILGVGKGSVSTEPTGLFYGSSGATYLADRSTASYSAVIALEKNVDIQNALIGNLAYIASPYSYHKLRTTAKVSSSDSVMIVDSLAYPVHVTSSVAYNVFTTTGSAGLIFGNWADLLIGQWGGYDLLVDPYTQAASGTIRLVVNCYFDAAAARSASFSAINMTV